MTNSITINVSPPYPVVFRALSDPALLAEGLSGDRVLIVSDSNVAPRYADEIQSALAAAKPDCRIHLHVIPAGESNKTMQSLAGILDALAAMGAKRDTVIVALGGGVVGDIAGLAAALWMRGIRCIQVPTTLLAMVDSSVGGKTAIDMPQGKNLVGAFHQPVQVRIDVDVLQSLPEREFKAGMAEVIKYAAIFSANFMAWLESNADRIERRDRETLVTMVRHCVQFKAEVVVRDPNEMGERALLNFGHTFGHALESALEFDGTMNHGEAVAIGMATAARLSERMLQMDSTHLERLERLLKRFDLRTEWPPAVDAETTIANMRMDKKALSSGLRFILLKSIGDAHVISDVPETAVMQVINEQFR